MDYDSFEMYLTKSEQRILPLLSLFRKCSTQLKYGPTNKVFFHPHAVLFILRISWFKLRVCKCCSFLLLQTQVS